MQWAKRGLFATLSPQETLNDWKKLHVRNSSVSTRFRVLAVVDAKMVKPAPDRPYEGMINIHSEISPMASSEYEQGRYVIYSLSKLLKWLLTQAVQDF